MTTMRGRSLQLDRLRGMEPANFMFDEPFDEEMDHDTMVPSDAAASEGDPKPIETAQDFKRRLRKLSPQELALLLAKMKGDKP